MSRREDVFESEAVWHTTAQYAQVTAKHPFPPSSSFEFWMMHGSLCMVMQIYGGERYEWASILRRDSLFVINLIIHGDDAD